MSHVLTEASKLSSSYIHHFRFKMSKMQAANRLWTALNNGQQSFGAWQMIRGANVSRLLARTGVDWVLVDCEHGDIDGMMLFAFTFHSFLTSAVDGAMHEAVPAIADAGVSPIVRPPGMEGWMIKSWCSRLMISSKADRLQEPWTVEPTA